MDPPEPLAEIARGGVEGTGGLERSGRRGEVAASQVQLAAVGEHVLRPDGGRVAAVIECAAGIERLGRGIELAQVAQRAREVKQHLHLDAAAALALLGRRLVPDLTRAAESVDRLPRTVQLLEAVAAAEEAQVIGREGREGAVVPAERLGPLLLALEVPADRAVKDGGAARGELGAPEQVPLDLLLVPEHAERAADLEEELGGVPRLFLGRIVECPVARDDGVMGFKEAITYFGALLSRDGIPRRGRDGGTARVRHWRCQ